MGMIAILHAWKQDLDYHPHLHCIIPSGGITVDNTVKALPNVIAMHKKECFNKNKNIRKIYNEKAGKKNKIILIYPPK